MQLELSHDRFLARIVDHIQTAVSRQQKFTFREARTK
jgi:hypothetical protein